MNPNVPKAKGKLGVQIQAADSQRKGWQTPFFDVDKFHHMVYNYRPMKEIGSKTFYDHRDFSGVTL